MDLFEIQKSFLEELMEIDEIVGRLQNSNVKIELQEKLYDCMMIIKKDQSI